MSDSVREGARRILASMRGTFGGPATLVPVDETALPHLDLARYRSFRSDMEAAGFRYLADLEMLELSRSPTMLMARTMLRNLVSADGTIVADYYQVKPRVGRYLRALFRGLVNGRFAAASRMFVHGMKTRHCAGFETEFTDGRFLVTSNAHSASKISGPPTIESKFFAFGTPVDVVLDAHRARLAEILRDGGGVEPVRMSTTSELLKMYERQSTQKSAYRASVQWVTKDELHKMSSNPAVADAVFEEVLNLLKGANNTPGA